MVSEDLTEKGRFKLPLEGNEGMSHVDIQRKNIRSRGNSLRKISSGTRKELRSLCAAINVYSDFTLSHMGVL